MPYKTTRRRARTGPRLAVAASAAFAVVSDAAAAPPPPEPSVTLVSQVTRFRQTVPSPFGPFVVENVQWRAIVLGFGVTGVTSEVPGLLPRLAMVEISPGVFSQRVTPFQFADLDEFLGILGGRTVEIRVESSSGATEFSVPFTGPAAAISEEDFPPFATGLFPGNGDLVPSDLAAASWDAPDLAGVDSVRASVVTFRNDPSSGVSFVGDSFAETVFDGLVPSFEPPLTADLTLTSVSLPLVGGLEGPAPLDLTVDYVTIGPDLPVILGAGAGNVPLTFGVAKSLLTSFTVTVSRAATGPDFDRDGGVDAGDVLAYLAAADANAIEAELDAAEGVTVFDLLGYLSLVDATAG